MPETVETLKAAYRARRVLMLDGLTIFLARATESPIEELVLWALLHLDAFDETGPSAEHRLATAEAGDLPGFVEPRGVLKIVHPWPHFQDYFVQPRVRVGAATYRLDLAVSVQSIHFHDLRVFVDVECDGHDFHERTKEQAEHDKRRDRDLQSIGWSVARLTGSEIVRDPLAAAWSALELAYGVLSQREAERKKAVAR